MDPITTTQMPLRARQRASNPKNFRRDRRGTSALEFVVATPLLILMLTAVVDLGLAIQTKIQTGFAVEAGTMYAERYGWDVTAIGTIVLGTTSLSSLTASPAASKSCGCPSGTTITAATCGSTCTAGGTAGTYVYVNATTQYSSIMPYLGFNNAMMTFKRQSVVRLP